MTAKFYIEGDEKTWVNSLEISWDVNALAYFSVTLLEAESITEFSSVTVDRDEVEVFGGRIENPEILFGAGGTSMFLNGYDYTVKLRDYLTPSQSIVDSDTATALAAIVTNTGFSVSTSGTFSYISILKVWDTSLEFLVDIDTWTNTVIEFDTSSLEINDEFADGRTIVDFANAGLHNAFFYDGTTQRFYVFTREGTTIIQYHSADGDTWTRTILAYTSSTASWSVAWHGSKVYLFVFDGANTDFYRGTINDGTGAITFALIAGNIFANELRYGPVWDDGGHMWVVEASATGTAWESTDDGLNWNNRFSAPANHTLWAVLPQGTDGDMYGFVVDVPNDDLEEWLWDRSGGTFSFVGKIEDTVNDIDSLDGGSNADYRPMIAWQDGTDGWFAVRTDGGGWTTDQLGGSANSVRMAVDGGLCGYIIANETRGTYIYKYKDAVQSSATDYSAEVWGASGSMTGCSRLYNDQGDVGVFFCGVDNDSDGWFILSDPTGIRISRGSASGSFQTEAVNASGTMEEWGILNGSMLDVTDGVWDILKAADDSVLLNDVEIPYDMYEEGELSNTETSIKVKGQLTDSGADPYVYEFDVSERVDEVSLDTDYEDCLVGVQKLASLNGAEFWVTKDNGTYTLHMSTSRGTDKSGTVVLKNALTGDEPTVAPNIKVLGKTFGWDNYANCIRVTGGTVGGVRIEQTLKDHTEIARLGQEVWKHIRDDDIVSDAMARQRAAMELWNRNSAVIRIEAEFLDTYDSGQIEIGDTVTLIAEWEDASLKVSGSHRIIQLTRRYGADGEQVSASFINEMKAMEYWQYLKKTSALERWATA